MAKVLLIAEHDGTSLNPNTGKCIACASSIAGAEIDLVVIRGGTRLGFEFKRTVAPKVTKSMRIAIEDTGIGMPPETLEQIFHGRRVDDDALETKALLETLAEALEQDGLAVITAADGREALERFRAEDAFGHDAGLFVGVDDVKGAVDDAPLPAVE